MKHLKSALIIITLLSFTACSGGQNGNPEDQPIEVSVEEQQEVRELEGLTNEAEETVENLTEEAEELENELDSLLN